MQTGYSNPHSGYARGPLGHDGENSPSGPSSQSGGYGMTQGVSNQTTAGTGGVTTQSYDSYGRTQQQYPYPSTTIAGYGGAYGLYGQTTTAPRTISAQDGYEGAYGAYRQGATSQNRLDRGYKPY